MSLATDTRQETVIPGIESKRKFTQWIGRTIRPGLHEEGKLKPEEQVKELGRALVKQVFSISRLGAIAGCHVLDGTIQRGCRVRVNREGRGIGDYALGSLRREKDDVKEVRKGYECGMKLDGFNDLKEGDILEAYDIEEVKRTLDSDNGSE